MSDYLNAVEADLGVMTVWGVRAMGVERRGTGSALQLSTTDGEIQTRNIVCATGASSRPRIPDWASAFRVTGVLLHSSEYLYPHQIPTSDVLIVGGGNSGVQLARELAASHSVTLAVRTPRRHGPLSHYPRSRRSRRLFPSGAEPELVFGDSYEELRAAGVTISRAVVSASKNSVTFADGSSTAPGSMILATGFDSGDDWLPDQARTRSPQRTMTGLPGLFVAGMPRYGGNDTIAGISRDASTIARRVIDRP